MLSRPCCILNILLYVLSIKKFVLICINQVRLFAFVTEVPIIMTGLLLKE